MLDIFQCRDCRNKNKKNRKNSKKLCFWIKFTATIVLGLFLASCSNQEPIAQKSESSSNTQSTYTGLVETISLSLDAGLDLNSESTTRALSDSTFYHGRLRPAINGDKVDVMVYLASGDTKQFSQEKLSFDYDKKTNSIHYRGNITVPEGLLQAPNLKMFLIVANNAKVRDGKMHMENVNTEYFENKQFPDDEILVIDVPYFSNWIEVSKFIDGKLLDVDRSDEKILLRPQGHVLKMEVSSSLAVLKEVVLTALQVGV